MLTVKDVVEINKLLDKGNLVNPSSLDFAVKSQQRSKNWLRSSAVFTRAILIDHVFEDGNKRTAAAALMTIMEIAKIDYDPGIIPKIIVRILQKNVTSIQEIERCIKNGIRKY